MKVKLRKCLGITPGPAQDSENYNVVPGIVPQFNVQEKCLNLLTVSINTFLSKYLLFDQLPQALSLNLKKKNFVVNFS